MIQLQRTNAANLHFTELVKLLDADLAIRDGEAHAFYAQFNKTAMLNHVIVAYEDTLAVGCGAIRELTPTAMEVKRMYTRPEHRGRGIAAQILAELEKWAAELAYKKCMLETGKNQPEAIAMYTNKGYRIIPNYGQYQTIENSVCFEKVLDIK
jgi:putative acetyltransferase